ncbi:BON domain-containing protein [Lacimicrobium alkaliphilum]|uniref:Transporter n=1 Tax=Lacimicrobium alkaliphilum TaxID=1526571 RepID=A0ABQ1R2P2_9ALTE|nr:BON domain-containing protein [Lacimicrobium alkaliphilum]GGD54225.1 transporter [Lacimicrobium alkaliphilum]
MKLTTTLIALSLFTAPVALADNNWEDKSRDAWLDGKAETTLLLNSNLNSFDIDTDVKNGVVTLSGKVESEVDKALASELVASLEGVKEVDNKLEVAADEEEQSSEVVQTLTDSKVATVVKTRLLFESEVSGSAINVDANKGEVTLEGEVSSEAERDLAITIAENTSDVKKVTDKLKVTSKS